MFRFDVSEFLSQDPDCFTNFKPLNLSSFNTVQLDELGVKFEQCNDDGYARIAVIKWKLDDDCHKPYINLMFEYIRSRRP